MQWVHMLNKASAQTYKPYKHCCKLMSLRVNTNIPICLLSYIPECITQRWECKSTVNGESFKPTYHTWECIQAGHFLKCCAVNITRGDVGNEAPGTVILVVKYTHRRVQAAVNRRLLSPDVGTQSLESYFSALSIHSLLGELNYSQSNLVSHLFSSAGLENYLHEAAIEL